ncbi:MAG: rod shape-determining protein [Planctomycetota bacterium]|nr:rod shape-determining protein [Planctomycetota bacterium]
MPPAVDLTYSRRFAATAAVETGRRHMIQWVRQQFCPDLAVDLGTANTRVAVAGEGIALDEPTVVALRHGTRQVLGRGTAVGRLAKQMLGRTPEGVTAVRPIRSGVVTDFEVCEAMLRYFFTKASRQSFGLRPRVILAVPGTATPVERRAVFNSAERAGAGEVFLLDKAFAAGLGGGLPVAEPIASMVCDLGGGTTEIAVFSLGEIVASKSLRLGGDDFDDAIADYLRRTYTLTVGPQTAERLKQELGSASPLEEELTDEVGGLDGVSNVPRKAVITSEDVREALHGPLERIVSALRSVIEKCPPEIVSDLADQGLILTGGGALLRRIDGYLADQLGIPVRAGRNPLHAVATGASVCVDHFADWKGCLESGERAA